jgi:hypothetical protein
LRDRNGHALAHVYFENDRAGSAGELLTPEAAKHVAAQLEQLPNLLVNEPIPAHSTVMRHPLRLHRHWDPVQQTAGPGFRGGQLPVVAKVGDNAGEDDRGRASECGPEPCGRGSTCRSGGWYRTR